ncbi:hypothetical protein [Mangrovicella endophytica]|uniref:hypothetical protein n=1 Tax=Mangrovicella endophytica TaxID=2066697 RepID=UPI000C9E1A77|nr:hypothetical protein [Mangrovicella endophytica]
MSHHPLSGLMSRVSSELDELSRSTEELHDLTIDIEWPETAIDAGFVRAAQKIDFLCQALSNLAGYLDALSVEVPADCRIDATAALSALKLSELKNRLSTEETAVRGPESDGELELFG